MDDARIQLIKQGPAHVSGNVSLYRRAYLPQGRGYTWDQGEEIPHQEEYSLCRCGHSKDTPFCDGSHAELDYADTETFDRRPYLQRSRLISGPQMTLADDYRCAYARFCHSDAGDAWTLAASAQSESELQAAQEVIDACPAGRLSRVIVDESAQSSLVPLELEPEIVVMEDPEKGCSAGIYVQGGIPLYSADSTPYETRDRYVLCRCGASREQPFCNAMHVNTRFNDGHLADHLSES